MRKDLFELGFEKLGDEGGRYVQSEGLDCESKSVVSGNSDMAYFFIASRLAAEFKGRFETMGEEVTFDIEVFCIFNKWCNFG